MSKIIIAFYIVSTSAALIVLKLGSSVNKNHDNTSSRLLEYVNFHTLAGITLYGVSFLFYIYLISKYDLGYIIPLTAAFIYVVVFTASYFIFNESFTVTKIVGISLILIGLMFLNYK